MSLYVTTINSELVTFSIGNEGQLKMATHGNKTAEYNADKLLKEHNSGNLQLSNETIEKIKKAGDKLR